MRYRILIGMLILKAGLPCDGHAQEMLPDTICGEAGERSYFVTGWPGSTYTWTVEGGAILPPVNTDTITIDWTGVPQGVYAITVVEHAENGCSGDPFTGYVSIILAPDVIFQPCIPITSRDAKPFALKGAIPLNGLYSGTGVQSGVFDPGQVPPGQDTVIIRYHYTNAFGCYDSDSAILTLHPAANHTCGDLLIDVRDNQEYATILLGNRCWMAENLNYGTHIAGTSYQMDNCLPEKYCYNEATTNCTNFGGIYQWDELMDYQEADTVQGLCPPGWHVPTETQWQELIAAFQDAAHAGTALKDSGISGFDALLKGFFVNPSNWKYGASDTTLHSTLFWTSTLSGQGKAWAHGLNTVLAEPTFTTSVSSYSADRPNGFAVRCMKDD